MSDSQQKLKQALKRLEASTQKIVETRGYGKDVKSLKMLEELIKEQLINENSSSSTRTIR